ncbi:MAG TPA: hypothetical protein PKB05_00370 [Oligoflexia bacterium]|nr:hypothetical protein [Oligoflexia bacterium]
MTFFISLKNIYAQNLQQWPKLLVDAITELRSNIKPEQYGFALNTHDISIHNNYRGNYFTVHDDFSEVIDGYECYGQAVYIKNYLTDFLSDHPNNHSIQINLVAGKDELNLWSNHSFVQINFDGEDYIIDFTPPFHLRMPSTQESFTLPLQHQINESLNNGELFFRNHQQERRMQIEALGALYQHTYPYKYITINQQNFLFSLSMLRDTELDTYYIILKAVTLPRPDYKNIQSKKQLNLIQNTSNQNVLSISRQIDFFNHEIFSGQVKILEKNLTLVDNFDDLYLQAIESLDLFINKLYIN